MNQHPEAGDYNYAHHIFCILHLMLIEQFSLPLWHPSGHDTIMHVFVVTETILVQKRGRQHCPPNLAFSYNYILTSNYQLFLL